MTDDTANMTSVELRQRANKLFAANKTDEAIEAFGLCIEKCDQDDHKELAILNNNLGIAYKTKDMIEEALISFTKAIILDRTYIKPLF